MENDERCVCCGEIIPEGRMVCPNCEVASKGKRLIDANALISNLRTFKGLGRMVAETLVRFTEKQPTVDAVEVVRCKDCKHLIVANKEYLYAYCPKMNTCFLPFQLDTREHFCSKGERKTENDTKCVDSITPQTKKALEMMGKTAHGEIDFDYEAED